MIPVWEEEIVYQHPYNCILHENALAFFEMLDFVTSSESIDSNSTGWYPIAFAFLKIIGAKKRINVGGKVRLQLYRYPKGTIIGNNFNKVPDVYRWWSSAGPRIKYPSTL